MASRRPQPDDSVDRGCTTLFNGFDTASLRPENMKTVAVAS